MLTRQEIEAIRSSWIVIASRQAAAGEMFYEILFGETPALRRMFRDGPEVQGRKLMDTLATVVDTLDRLDIVMPLVEDLGRRHADYGAQPAHYDAVGRALVGMLRGVCGSRLDPRAEAAWRRAYDLLARTMIAATRSLPAMPEVEASVSAPAPGPVDAAEGLQDLARRGADPRGAPAPLRQCEDQRQRHW